MINSNMIGQDKPTIIYVGDPMCSWCYGISNEVQNLMEKLGAAYNFEIMVGGLRRGIGVEWNEDFTYFLRHHWEEVSRTSGQEFNYKILESEDFSYNTEPSCRSIVVIREIAPHILFEWFAAVQIRFYKENKNPNSTLFYKPICEKFGIDYNEFKPKFEHPDFIQKTKEEFDRVQQLGVRSFPTIIMQKNQQYYRITNGYAKSKQMLEMITRIESRL